MAAVRHFSGDGQAENTPAANWYADPTGKHQHRYWDGTQWTGHVADHGTQTVDPLPVPEVKKAEHIEARPQPEAAPPETRDAYLRRINATKAEQRQEAKKGWFAKLAEQGEKNAVAAKAKEGRRSGPGRSETAARTTAPSVTSTPDGLFMGRKITVDRGALSRKRPATQAEIDQELDRIREAADDATKNWTRSKRFTINAHVEAEVRARKLMEGKIATKEDIRKGINQEWTNRSAGFWGLIGIGIAADWLHGGFGDDAKGIPGF